MKRDGTELEVIQDEHDGEDKSPERKHRERRTLVRRESIINYKPS